MSTFSHGMAMDLTVAVNDSFSANSIMLAWLDGGTRSIEPGWRASLDESSPRWSAAALEVGNPESPLGPPGGLVASITSRSTAARQTRTEAYVPQMLNSSAMANRDIGYIDMEVIKLGDRGFRSDALSLGANRFRGSGQTEYVQLLSWFTESEFTDSAERIERRLAYIRGFADRFGVIFGHISYCEDSLAATAWERAINAIPFEDIERCAEFARGFSWLTLLSESLMERLGGIRRLVDSGAFLEVSPLDGGGVWLKAASTWREFHDDCILVGRVRDVIAPVLLPGDVRDGNLKQVFGDHSPILLGC